jgi:hypothetical protein
MSHFGNSPRTQEAERRMALWRQAHPDAPVSEYNRAYTATWNSLTGFSDHEVTQLDRIFDKMLTEAGPMEVFMPGVPGSKMVAFVRSDGTLAIKRRNTSKQWLRGADLQPPRHRKQATKGAFGKKR